MFISSILLIYGHYLKRKLTQFTLDDWYDLHREKHNKLIQLLISLLSLLNKYKITHFISDGALLGLARNGRMIPYDDDIDLVIYCKSDPITFMKKLKHILKANDRRGPKAGPGHDHEREGFRNLHRPEAVTDARRAAEVRVFQEKGTSAPSFIAIACNFFFLAAFNSISRSFASPNKVPAASEEPPPSPAPIGILFVKTILTPTPTRKDL